MFKQQILTKLIAHYESVIEELQTTDEWMDLIYKKYITCGICKCAKKVLNIDIYGSEWVEREGRKWGQYPCFAGSKSEAIELLQNRVDIMNRELLINE